MEIKSVQKLVHHTVCVVNWRRQLLRVLHARLQYLEQPGQIFLFRHESLFLSSIIQCVRSMSSVDRMCGAESEGTLS
jgi:hypothetical protein